MRLHEARYNEVRAYLDSAAGYVAFFVNKAIACGNERGRSLWLDKATKYLAAATHYASEERRLRYR